MAGMPFHVCLLASAMLAAAPVRTQGAWRPRPELSARTGHAVAYDPMRERVVLFGGQFPGTPVITRVHKDFLLGDTWEWDGVRWHYRPTRVAPSPRVGATMAFDPVRKTVILFGGDASRAQLQNDTWEWNGRVWRKLNPPVSPVSRAHAVMAMDPVRHRIVLFGGMLTRGSFGSHSPADDTWEWDGKRWIQRSPVVKPFARGGAAMAWDARTRRLVLIGGVGRIATLRDDMWAWDGMSWTRLQPGTLPPNAAEGPFDLAPDPVTGGVIAYSGRVSVGGNTQTWRWDGRAWTKLKANAGPWRSRQRIVTDPARKRIVLFGGVGLARPMPSITDTWTFDPGTLLWKRVDEADPLPLGYLETVYDAARDQVLIIGAEVPIRDPLRMWALEGDRLRELKPPRIPASRNAFALGYHAGSRQVVMFGGCTGACGREVWLWNGRTWTLSPHRSPVQWYCPTVVYDGRRDKLVLLCRASKQVWEWDPTGWVNRTPPRVPRQRSGFGAAYDPVRRRIVMFGGMTNQALDDTWEWDGSTWTERRPKTRPPARTDPGMVYVPWLGGVVMFSGSAYANGTNVQGDTWLWDGRDWKNLQLPLPSVRGVSSAVYDAGRARVVAGYGWIGLRPPPSRIWYLDRSPLLPEQHLVGLGGRLRLDVTLPQQAGQAFVLGLSHAPYPSIPLRAVPWVGVERLPLAPGPLLDLSLQAGLVGLLDQAGKASFAVPVPPDPRLLWFGFHAAGFAVGPGPSVTAVTNGVSLEIVK